MNDDYLVVSVEHTADQGAALAFGEEAKGHTYTNRVRLIKAATPYRSPIPKHRQLVGTLRPRTETTVPNTLYQGAGDDILSASIYPDVYSGSRMSN